MLEYRLQCRKTTEKKTTESKNPKIVKTKNGNNAFFQNLKCVIAKNRNLSKSKKLANYLVV